MRRAWQHSIFSRDPAFASLATQMRRQFVFDGCSANDARVSHLDQRRAFGISEKAWRNPDGSQFVGRAIVSTCKHVLSSQSLLSRSAEFDKAIALFLRVKRNIVFLVSNEISYRGYLFQ